ncbi:MAG: methyltransferase [Phycisphaerales bacterium]|nr:methyltransferase [Phycisphaerales bacterium]NNM24498.1 methyltransferase [Phycisphaerales bacterium]
MPPGRNARVYAVVRRIPRGRVATYGQIAELAGLGPHARQVGYALSALEDDRVPWHRVVNAQGAVSVRTQTGDDHGQQERLVAEGVRFEANGRIDLKRFRWRPRVIHGSGTRR